MMRTKDKKERKKERKKTKECNENYDGPNVSLFISILLHNFQFWIPNSEFRILKFAQMAHFSLPYYFTIPNSEFLVPKFALRISEFVYEVSVMWANGNR